MYKKSGYKKSIKGGTNNICSRCHFINRPDASYCGRCNNLLDKTSTPSNTMDVSIFIGLVIVVVLFLYFNTGSSGNGGSSGVEQMRRRRLSVTYNESPTDVPYTSRISSVLDTGISASAAVPGPTCAAASSPPSAVVLVPTSEAVSSPPGLTNLGNTCYFNALLQILSHSDRFFNMLASESARYPSNELLSKMHGLATKLRVSASKIEISPTEVLDECFVLDRSILVESSKDKDEQKSIFANNEQQDIQDAFTRIYNFFTNSLKMQFNISVLCNLNPLSIPYLQYQLQSQNNTLLSILQQFTRPFIDQLIASFIDTRIMKNCKITRLPKLLMISLRYEAPDHINKLNYTIDYPLFMQLKLTNGREYNYKLVGVANHHGARLAGGHYTADFISDGKWYHASDNNVKPFSEIYPNSNNLSNTTILRSSVACMLLYEKIIEKSKLLEKKE
jgi:hypothetical protein